jgi:hypothetical protein
MNPATIINALANGILTAGVSAFMIMLYRSDGVVRRWPMTGSVLLKISLVATASGALFNCLTLSTPTISEIVLNCGLAGVFAWAAAFHAKLLKDGPNSQHGSGNSDCDSEQDFRSEGPNP